MTELFIDLFEDLLEMYLFQVLGLDTPASQCGLKAGDVLVQVFLISFSFSSFMVLFSYSSFLFHSSFPLPWFPSIPLPLFAGFFISSLI